MSTTNDEGRMEAGSPSRIEVVLVDLPPDPLVLGPAREALEGADLEVVGLAPTGDEVVETLRGLKSHKRVAVLVSLQLEGERDCHWVIRQVRTLFPSMRVIGVTREEDDASVERALLAGADDIVRVGPADESEGASEATEPAPPSSPPEEPPPLASEPAPPLSAATEAREASEPEGWTRDAVGAARTPFNVDGVELVVVGLDPAFGDLVGQVLGVDPGQLHRVLVPSQLEEFLSRGPAPCYLVVLAPWLGDEQALAVVKRAASFGPKVRIVVVRSRATPTFTPGATAAGALAVVDMSERTQTGLREVLLRALSSRPARVDRGPSDVPTSA